MHVSLNCHTQLTQAAAFQIIYFLITNADVKLDIFFGTNADKLYFCFVCKRTCSIKSLMDNAESA